MKLQLIDITSISECRYCGIETEFINDSDAQDLDTWLQDNYGETLEDAARGYSESRTGFTWVHGGNYSWEDSDLLGGDGSGSRSSKAEGVFQFVYSDAADKSDHACAECASYL